MPEHSDKSPAHRITLALVLISFLLVVLGTVAIDLASPLPLPRIAGSEKAAFERMKKNAKWSDGSLARLFEYEYRVRSRVRANASKPYANFMFRTLGETHSKVLLGKDGWLFLKDRVAVSFGPPEMAANRSAAFHGAISRRLHSLGMRYILLPLPRKSVICEESLPIGADPARAYDEAILPAMKARGVETVDLLKVWEAEEDGPLYRHTDTHWSTKGMRLTAHATTSFAGLAVQEGKRRGEIRREIGGGKRGGLYAMIQVEPRGSDNKFQNQEYLSVEKDGQELTVHDPAASLVICGTSFCAHDDFATFLSHYSGQTIGSYDSPGRPSVTSLLRMLNERSGTAFPKIVLDETPNHMAIAKARNLERWSLDADAGELFASFLPNRVIAIPSAELVPSQTVPVGVPTKITGGRRLTLLKEGTIAHGGAGEVEFAIEVVLNEGNARLVLKSGKCRYMAPLHQGLNRVLLPVLYEQPGVGEAEILVLTSTPSAVITRGSISLVSALDVKSNVPATISPPQWSLNEGSQDVSFPRGTEIKRHATLILKLAADSGKITDIRLSVSNEAGDTKQVFKFPVLEAGGSMIISPGLLAGMTIGQVQLTWKSQSSTSPLGGLSSANLYDM